MYWVGFPLAIALAVPMLPAGGRGLRDAGLVRTNYRGAVLAFPLGAILATVSLVALAPLAVLNDRASLDLLPPDLRRWLPYLLGIAFLGFLDDALGQGEAATTPRGWRGHWGALREGRLSTGAIKAIGAVALAAYVVSGQGLESWRWVADVALLVLTTNLGNLLDLRPGRAEKALALLGAALCLFAWTLAPIELLGIFAGPALVGAWLTLGRDVVLLGTVTEEQLACWYHSADALCFPSVKEGWGLAVLEAMAAGLPVVASDLPVFGEYLEDGVSALLPPVADDVALARAMRSLVHDAELRERLVAGGRAVLPRFTWEATARRHREIYARIRFDAMV